LKSITTIGFIIQSCGDVHPCHRAFSIGAKIGYASGAMKVLILVQDIGFGGSLRQASLLTEGLLGKGHEVTVCGWLGRGDDWKFVWSAPVEPEIMFNKNAGGHVKGVVRLVRASAALRARLKDEKFDILYGMQGDVARLAAWLATRGMDTALVWGRRGSSTGIAARRRWKEAFLFRLISWTAATVPLIIANSAAGFVTGYRSNFSRPRRLVIYNGFDSQLFKPDIEARHRLRSAWGVGAEKLIGVAARLAPFKGHAVFFAAIARITARHPDTRYVVVGDGQERGRLEHLARDVGVADKVIWAGAQADMNAVYNALDILCSPSVRGEGCPNVIGEAMACGVLCVVTDVGGSANVVGELGFVVPPNDAAALADALSAALDRLDTVDRRALRQRIMERFSVEAMVDETEKALLAVCGAGH
jgi:glycosyltransferase involved in cell wall biosynthesis